MPWQKIGELPDQRFVGPYGIEFWRIHKGQVFHQVGLLRKPDAASFEFIPRTLFRRARCARRLPRQDRPARDRPRSTATASASAVVTGWTGAMSTSNTRLR